jgi:hypothetical protein
MPVVQWPEDVDEVITADITAASAYPTRAGGAVVTGVAPCGIDNRVEGQVGFTTSLAFARKLEHIMLDPRIALAYHSREHGFSTSSAFVLAQGMAAVDLEPSQDRLEAFAPQAERYVGPAKRGPVWDRLLRQYYVERVFVDIAVERLVAWPDLGCAGHPEVFGPPPAPAPAPQPPPANGTEPRIDVEKAAAQLATLPHRVLAYLGADGLPVVVAVAVAGHDAAGLRLVAAPGLLPEGGRRAGLLAHAYRPQLIGLSTRTFTGWLEVSGDGRAVYAPHTSKGFVAPPSKNLLLVANGLMSKWKLAQARRRGVSASLARSAAEAAAGRTAGASSDTP